MAVILENAALRVSFGDVPWFDEIVHHATGIRLRGAEASGCLTIDGQAVAWSKWRISRTSTGAGHLAWRLEPTTAELPDILLEFTLASDRLKIRVAASTTGPLGPRSIGATGLSLVGWQSNSGCFYREEVRQLSWKRIKFLREDRKEEVRFGVVDRLPVPSMHACVFNGKGVAFAVSNQRVTPFETRVISDRQWPERSSGFAIGFADWEFGLADRPRSPLQLEIVILGDTNGDGNADECDYLRFLNRRLPEPSHTYRDGFWYKISMADQGRGLVTTYAEALEVIRAIHHVTGGLPQVALLTGWKFKEWEQTGLNLDLMGFGAMEALAETPGTLAELHALHKAAAQLNCAVSYHINVDDTYQEHNSWDPSIVCRETDGSLVEWLRMFGRTAYHISHTKDVRSGAVFQRLQRLLETVPVSAAIHLDAFRNTNLSWDQGGTNSLTQELERGCNPIIDYLEGRGLAVSIEGARQMPIDQIGWVGAFWHLSRVTDFLPRLVHFHGKAIGGAVVGVPDRVAWGLGSSTNRDVCFRSTSYSRMLSIKDHWAEILDILYLGYFLYRFYLQRELLRAGTAGGYHELWFDGGLHARVATDGSTLKVEMDGIVFAEDDDRFLPFKDAIYAYSRNGSHRSWRLPPEWCGVKLEAVSLSREGSQPVGPLNLRAREVELVLQPRVPLKITRLK